MPSSVIRRIEYDAERELLFVTFVSGKLYAYERVPAEVHGAFATASSKGEFFNRFIRDRYRYREVIRRRDVLAMELGPPGDVKGPTFNGG